MNFSSELKCAVTRIVNKHFPLETAVEIPIDDVLFSYIWFEGTYIIYSGKSIIYVGVSSKVGDRLRSHVNGKNPNPFNSEITSIKVVRFNSWDEAADLESYLIFHFRPKYNRTIPSEYLLFQYMRYRSKNKKAISHSEQTIEKIALELNKAQGNKTDGSVAPAFRARIHDETSRI